MMKAKILTLVAILTSSMVHAQTSIDEIYKKITPQQGISYAFLSIDGQSKILAYGGGISNVYDDEWNILESHSAGQAELNTSYYYLTRSCQYDSNKGSFTATSWEKKQYSSTTPKYTYYVWNDNYTKFYNGEANTLYYLRSVNKVFLRSHTVYTFSDSYTGIAGQLNYISHQYAALTTAFNLVDWEGNILCTINPPYYLSSGYCQAIDVNDKTYLIVTAYSMYPKNVIQDCDTYSTANYDLSSKEIEANYYHYFIYKYDKLTNSVEMVKSEKSLADRTPIAMYDTNGNKLSAPQKGINIILYSDGTTEKIIRK